MAFAVAVMKKFGDDQAGNQVALLTYFAFVATFPLLLALTTILGVALRKYPELQRDLVNSAFAEFPIIGTQIHDQLGVATFGNAFSLTVGVLGALFGGRGFANALQNTFSTLWSVPKVDRPGFPTKYLRAAGLLLLLTVGAAVTAAAGAAAGAATALGLHGFECAPDQHRGRLDPGLGLLPRGVPDSHPGAGPDTLDAARGGDQCGGLAAAADWGGRHHHSSAAPRPSHRGPVRHGTGLARMVRATSNGGCVCR